MCTIFVWIVKYQTRFIFNLVSVSYLLLKSGLSQLFYFGSRSQSVITAAVRSQSVIYFCSPVPVSYFYCFSSAQSVILLMQSGPSQLFYCCNRVLVSHFTSAVLFKSVIYCCSPVQVSYFTAAVLFKSVILLLQYGPSQLFYRCTVILMLQSGPSLLFYCCISVPVSYFDAAFQLFRW
jgi:hypothetical protein